MHVGSITNGQMNIDTLVHRPVSTHHSPKESLDHIYYSLFDQDPKIAFGGRQIRPGRLARQTIKKHARKETNIEFLQGGASEESPSSNIEYEIERKRYKEKDQDKVSMRK